MKMIKQHNLKIFSHPVVPIVSAKLGKRKEMVPVQNVAIHLDRKQE